MRQNRHLSHAVNMQYGAVHDGMTGGRVYLGAVQGRVHHGIVYQGHVHRPRPNVPVLGLMYPS